MSGPTSDEAGLVVAPFETIEQLIDAPLADRNPALIYLASLTAPATQRSALRGVAALFGVGRFEVFPWASLRFQHVAGLRARLVEAQRAPATINRILSAVRGVLKIAYALGQLDGDDYRRAVGVAGVKAGRLPAGRHVARSELARLFEVCGGDATIDRRDRVLLALLYGAALRRAEVVSLSLGALIVGGPAGLAVRLIGKGNKERQVPLTVGGVADALDRWIEVRPTGVPLVCQTRDLQACAQLSVEAVGRRLARLAKRADVAPFAPHDLRRTFIADAFEAGIDAATIAAVVGHSDIRTTGRYDRRVDAARAEAVAVLSLPT